MSRIQCRWCDYSVQSWWRTRKGKLVGPDRAYARLAEHVASKHPHHNRKIQDKLDHLEELHPEDEAFWEYLRYARSNDGPGSHMLIHELPD